MSKDDGDAGLAHVANDFWRGLVLLGFNDSPEAAWARSQHGGSGSVGPHMFDSATSNESGLLAALHFVLVRAPGAVGPSARKSLAGLFPVRDSAQRREFKARVRELLAELERLHLIPLGTARGSTLNTARGRPAQALLWVLAHAATRGEVQRLEAKLAVAPAASASAAGSELGDMPELGHVLGIAVGSERWAAALARAQAARRREQRRYEVALDEAAQDEAEQRAFVAELAGHERDLTGELRRLEHEAAIEAARAHAAELAVAADGAGADSGPAAAAGAPLVRIAADPCVAALEGHLAALSRPDAGPVRLRADADQVSARIAARIADMERRAAAASGARTAPNSAALLDLIAKLDRTHADISALTARVDVGLDRLNHARAEYAHALLVAGLR
jgi:hypothetical protein